MIKLSKQVDYGMQILTRLAQQAGEGPVSLKKISLDSGVSFLFLQKIARQLRAAGIIDSARGKDGGYVLAKPVSDITTRQVIEAIDGSAGLSACTRPGEPCARSHNCTLKGSMAQLNAKVLALLEDTTIAEFC